MTKSKTNRILIVNNGSKYEEDIIALCQKHGFNVDTVEWDSFDGNNFHHDMVILSGGHCLTVEEHERQFAGQIKLIQNRQISIVAMNYILIDKAL